MGWLRNAALGGLVVLTLATAGCRPIDKVKQESSPILYEKAVVEDVFFMPARHGDASGGGVTIDGEGNLGLALGGGDVNLPEKYAIVFKCQHGKFVVQGEGYYASRSKDSLEISVKDLWGKVSKGDSVDVSYREWFKCTYSDTDGDGQLELISKEFIDYDFLDANKF